LVKIIPVIDSEWFDIKALRFLHIVIFLDNIIL
jgi:hypothetical protein